MAAANIGTANASIRKMETPSETTSGTGVMTPIIKGAARYMIAPITVMTAIPITTVIRAKLRAKSWRFAPRLCPTNVVAASAIP